MTAVAERLRRRILDRGPMPFAEFMAEALYGDEGYYRSASVIGPAGDFITGSSWSPLFGRVTARLLRRLDAQLGRAAELLEVGAGSGAHLAAVLAAAGRPRRLLACDRAPRDWPPGIEPLSSADLAAAAVTGMVFSYELFDALPVHRVVGRPDGGYSELRVAATPEGAFGWVAQPPEDAALAETIAQRQIVLAPGQIAELALDAGALYRDLARALRRGLLVTCDYGFERRRLYDPRVRFDGTLACYRRHRVHRDAFAAPGEQDLTAHVDFDVLRAAGEAEGLETLAWTRQASWLVAAGLFDELATADDGERAAARRLLDGEGMGEEIRVLVQGRDQELEGLLAHPGLFAGDRQKAAEGHPTL